MSKPWGGIGAWAAEAERAEAEEREAAAASGIGSNADSQSFPSLKEAAKEKPKKKKMSLSEFTMGSYSSPAGGIGGARGVEYDRLTPEEMMILPTRPKERSAEEMQYGRLGGGFASYGRSGPPPGRAMRDREESDGSWGTGRRQYGGFDEERRGPPPRASEYDQPSRADEVDNWAMAKKSAPAFDSGRQNRYGGLGTGGGMSRADEVDNWLTGKKPIAARSSSFGSGFRGSAPEPDRWSRGVAGFREERPRLVLDPPRGEANEQVRTNKPDPFGAARPREEVLAQKGLDWKQVDSEIEAKKANERPTSSQSSRPSSAHSSRSETQQPGIENVLRTRPKVNPFGDAKPREVLLQERGQDWHKIALELQHRRVDRPEQDEERILKEEIDSLREELEKESSGDQSSLRDRLLQKEKDLEMLIRDFDDKIRFGQKVERPGSGAGRIGGFPDRPPSWAGSSDGSRSVDFTNRPRSHGTGDAWTRPGDDRRAFQGGRERGFLNRDMDSSRSRERW